MQLLLAKSVQYDLNKPAFRSALPRVVLAVRIWVVTLWRCLEAKTQIIRGNTDLKLAEGLCD
jgi:hypothetical protein